MRSSHLFVVPASGQVDVALEEVALARLGHLSLHLLQQVREPLERVCVWADPVEVQLLEVQIVLGIQVPVPVQSGQREH